MRALGAIIAGGQGRRFGGDKAAALFRGKPLIEHVAEALARQVADLVVVGRTWTGLPFLADRPQGALGPLAGLNAALHHASAYGYDGVISAGCDTLPILPDMASLLAGGGPAYLDDHFLLGWWPSALAPDLERHLAEQNDRSIRGWIKRCRARPVPPSAPLHNLNTRADLDAYERITAS
ncbi:molybdenum cofactor guanylyltransferase [Aquisediminimonas profunda]|uniref:molybdenum cofactor guanylyltransferase n=1 Tax=Aquisediminimonas profunda TaxID=1550733 RepID=UPI001C62B67F|nr:molybdenum cofactor guanylyltransferase [Aquisediminimonas profunda]